MPPIPSLLAGVAGENFVAAELSRRGYVASISLRNTRGICSNRVGPRQARPRGNLGFPIQSSFGDEGERGFHYPTDEQEKAFPRPELPAFPNGHKKRQSPYSHRVRNTRYGQLVVSPWIWVGYDEPALVVIASPRACWERFNDPKCLRTAFTLFAASSGGPSTIPKPNFHCRLAASELDLVPWTSMPNLLVHRRKHSFKRNWFWRTPSSVPR